MKATLLFSACLLAAVVLAALSRRTEAALGLDVSLQNCASITPAQWRCLREREGMTFAIIQAFQGGYQLNKDLAYCVNNAWAAGFAHVDIYAFMCPNCVGNNPPAAAVSRILNYARSNNITYGQLWFDIEQCTQCWNDVASNAAFMRQAVNAAVSYGASVGVYSSLYEWGVTVGREASGFPNLPLWYADWDNVQAFDDSWAWDFGGWTRPAIKQYYDRDSGVCGVSYIDLNWYPDS